MKLLERKVLNDMTNEELFKLNDSLERLADAMQYKWSDDIKELGERVDTATTPEKCHKNFIRLVYSKQFEINDNLNLILKEKSAEEMVELFRA